MHIPISITQQTECLENVFEVLVNCKIVQISDRTDLSTESGSGPIQLARDRYRVARRSVADSPPHCMNVQKIVSYYTRAVKKAAKLNILFTARRLKARPSAHATSQLTHLAWENVTTDVIRGGPVCSDRHGL